MTNACMSSLLYKSRQQFGIQRFVRAVMLALLLANFLQLFDAGYRMELVARGVSGIAASGLSTLAAFYLMQGLPQDKRSDERRVGKEGGSTCRYRWSPYH